jgi:hypothetical protein
MSPISKIEFSKPMRARLALALLAITVAAAGCGQQVVREDDATSSASGGTTTVLGNGTTTVSNGVTSVVDSTLDGLDPNYSFHVETKGSANGINMISGHNLGFTVNSVIKVRVKAGDGNIQLGGSGSGYGYSYAFNCQKFTVTIGNITKPVFVKKANYAASYNDPCASAVTEWTGDFSLATSTGQHDQTLIVSGMQTDNCARWDPSGYGPYYAGCPIAAVTNSNQIYDAYIEIYTDPLN